MLLLTTFLYVVIVVLIMVGVWTYCGREDREDEEVVYSCNSPLRIGEVKPGYRTMGTYASEEGTRRIAAEHYALRGGIVPSTYPDAGASGLPHRPVTVCASVLHTPGAIYVQPPASPPGQAYPPAGSGPSVEGAFHVDGEPRPPPYAPQSGDAPPRYEDLSD